MMRDQKLWTWHIAAGAVILVLLGLHMTIMHLDGSCILAGLNPAGGHPVDWENVVARGKSAFFTVTYVAAARRRALPRAVRAAQHPASSSTRRRWLKKTIGVAAAGRPGSGCSRSGRGRRWPASRWRRTF